MTVGEPLWPAMELLSPTARLDAWQEVPAFLLEYEAQDIITGDFLLEMDEAAVKVLPGLTFQPGGSLATDFQPVALSLACSWAHCLRRRAGGQSAPPDHLLPARLRSSRRQ